MRRSKTQFVPAILAGLMSILWGVAALGLFAPAPAHAARVATEGRTFDGFLAQERWVRIEAVRARGAGAKPAVVILHGASGIGEPLRAQAEALAERGISAFIVHYFDGLGPVARKASPELHARRDRIIDAAIEHVRSLPEVDADRVGLLGLSLGGFHAFGIASRDGRIAAVAGVVGAMPHPAMRAGIARMPPTLVLHGDRDVVVPVSRAHELARVLRRIGAIHQVKIYRGEAHVFRGPARADSIRTAAEFFAQHLAAAHSS
jgi:carboxymethylenebutenolidase